MDLETGPYDTERQATEAALSREIRALRAAGRVRSGDPENLVRNTMWRHLSKALNDAGVELGTYDKQSLAWLCGWEASTVQVIIGIIRRAAAGRTPPTDTPDPGDA